VDLRAPVTLPVYLDLLAVFLGGLAGSLRAVNKKFAITGVIALAIAAGLGGGIIRDLLLQRGGPGGEGSMKPSRSYLLWSSLPCLPSRWPWLRAGVKNQ
jgi:hypothetical protein